MGQQQIKDSQQQEELDHIEQVKIKENIEIEKAIQEHKQVKKEMNQESVPIQTYRKDFKLLKIEYQLNYYNSLYLSDIEGISLILIKIVGTQNINTFLNCLEFLNNLNGLQRAQFDIIDMNSAYFNQFMDSIKHVNTLQELNLSTIEESQLTPSDILSIVSWIGQQVNLKKLTLSFKISFQINNQFSHYFSNLFMMEKLRLEFIDNCQIGSEGLIELGIAISKFSRLIVLTLQITSTESLIDSQSISIFGKNLNELTSLDQLCFSLKQDRIYFQEIQSIYSILQSARSLNHFQVYIQNMNPKNKNQSIEDGMNIINTQQLTFNPLYNLKYFILNTDIQTNNYYSLTLLTQILPSLLNLETLQLNVADQDQFQEQHSIQFGQEIQKLTNLRDLEINIGYNNSFNKHLARYLMDSLSFCSDLIRLSLTVDEFNLVDIETIQYIFEGIQQLQNIKQIFLQFNHQYQLVFIGLLQYLKQLDDIGFNICFIDKLLIERQFMTNNLVKLNLHLSKLNQDGAQGLSQGLSKLIFLEYLHLNISQSFLGQNEYKSLGESLTNLNRLICLSFNFNEYENIHFNEFGVSLSSLPSLRFLILVVKQLNGLNLWIPKLINLNKISIQLKFDSIDSQIIDFNVLNEIFKNLIQLTYINLDIQCFKEYQLNIQDQFSLTESFKNLKYLNNLSIKIDQGIGSNDNSICNYLIRGLNNCHINLTKLQRFAFNISNGNQFNANSLLILADIIQNLDNLKKLQIKIGTSNQKFENKEYLQLIQGFRKLTQLNILQFDISQFYFVQYEDNKGQMFQEILNSLKQLPIIVLQLNHFMNKQNQQKLIKNLKNLVLIQQEVQRRII